MFVALVPEDDPVPEVALDAGVVAMVYVEPPKTVVAIPAAPLEASVIASPPAEVMMVAACPPKAMTTRSSYWKKNWVCGYSHVTSEKTDAAKILISTRSHCNPVHRHLPPDVASANIEPLMAPSERWQ